MGKSQTDKIVLAELPEGTGTRRAGISLNHRIMKNLEANKLTVLDFDGKDIVGSGWADEVFGTLVKSHGPMILCGVKCEKVSEGVGLIINMAISQGASYWQKGQERHYGLIS